MLTGKKSLLCSFLAAVIVIFSSLPCASAQELPDAEQAMRAYIGSSFDPASFHIAGESKGAAVCTYFDKKEYGQNGSLVHYVAADWLGDYIFTSRPCFKLRWLPKEEEEYFSHYQIGIFIIKDGVVTDLRTAYKNGAVDIAEVAAMQFTGYDLTIAKTSGKLTPREAICVRYFEEFDREDYCPIFTFSEEERKVEGYDICHFNATDQGYMNPAFHMDVSCGYLMRVPGYGPYQPAVFAIKGRDVYTFEEAYKRGLFANIDAVAELTEMRKIGDCDNDREITVKDILYVQKYLAGIVPLPDVRPYGAEYVLDFDEDYNVTVLDAIAMQKLIAKTV